MIYKFNNNTQILLLIAYTNSFSKITRGREIRKFALINSFKKYYRFIN